MPPGVIFVLKNVNNDVNRNKSNLLHPFYIVYVHDSGEAFYNHLSPRKILDTIRYLCRGKDEPDRNLCKEFNRETRDGRNMKKYSALLEDAISQIIDVKDESDISSLFKPGGTSALLTGISGMDDFELICFLIVK